MTLANARIVLAGDTPYAHEREAIDFAVKQLPNTDPYHLWALLELLDASSGRLYEIDLLILGHSALYLVEIKSGPGKYKGDFADWWRIPPEGHGAPRYMDPPIRLANLKAKVLKSRITSKLRDRRHAPRVEPLVFLSHADTDVSGLRADGRVGVVTRSEFLRAITHHDFPGSDPDRKPRRIDRPAARDIADALEAIGIRARKGKAHVGSYELGPILAEGPGFQDRQAEHRDAKQMRRRARTYLVPEQTSVERRQQLRRAADREAQLLYDVREHPGVLQVTEYVTDAELGPTVLLDDFDGGVTLSSFMRTSPDLSLDARVGIVEQVGRAVAYCHKKSVVHGALSPEAILVRARDGHIETRLFNFQLGMGEHVEATSHWSALASEPWGLYQAPELRENPAARSHASDVFSLGALAYFVFTGRAPADTLPEYLKRLATQRQLDPRAVANSMHEGLAELICEATHVTPLYRIDDAGIFVDLMLEQLTEPDPKTGADEEIDPLVAGKESILDGDLLVEGILGHGATSRVLQVVRESDDRPYALKISLADDHDERIEREASVLGKLRHPRIVQLIEARTIHKRRCLLLSLAGSETLQRYLAREGMASLDLASRYGEDLLLALEHLEDEQVMHRDIKPANLGVGTATKKGYHLTLFDFSLAFSSVHDLDLGTAVYRDPFLAQRGAWDYAAERWSAAVTLHEMLTGVRPHYGELGGSALDPEAKLWLAAERFDSAARDRLVAFFERALGRAAEARFESAKAMRLAWNACFEAPSVLPVGAEGAPPQRQDEGAKRQASSSELSSEQPPADELSDEQLRAIGLGTPLGALPLSTRARNALDRSGILHAADLIALADNHLSAMRGIGRTVAREIMELRSRLSAAQAMSAPGGAGKAFFPDYRGADLMLAPADVDRDAALVLSDAGLHTLGAVASASASQVRALAARHGFDAKGIHQILEHEHHRADEDEPVGLESWIGVLLPKRLKRSKYLLALFGLTEPFVGRLDVRNKEVAAHFGVTSAAVSIALGEARAEWQQRATVRELRDACRAILEEAGGAMWIGRMADELVSRWPGAGHGPRVHERARAAAIARIVCELERDDDDGVVLVRLRDEQPWILAREALAPLVRRLGIVADQLAAREVLASPGEVGRALGDVVGGSALERLTAERLTELAAAASKKAARSPRLELYPRGMAAKRALDLSAAVLKGGLAPIHVAARISMRYPEAESLPDRPELDELLAAHDLVWSDQSQCYERPGERRDASTTFSSLTSVAASAPFRVRPLDPKLVMRKDFEERIQSAIERRAFRVLGVSADRAELAAVALARRFDLEIANLDTRLIAQMRRQMERLKIQDARVVHEADREGPGGKAWSNLVSLAERAAEALADELLPPKRPLLVVQPGLIARYRLERFVDRVLEASRRDDAQAILLLVPAHDTGGIPSINGELVISGVLPAQALWVPRAWLSSVQEETAA